MSLEYKKENTERARELRIRATPQERHLWYDFLSTYSVRFQRQKAIGNYIVDFYCHRARLALEIDGPQHYTPESKAYDNARSAALAEKGVLVVRFFDGDIETDFAGVCHTIDKIVKERIEEE